MPTKKKSKKPAKYKEPLTLPRKMSDLLWIHRGQDCIIEEGDVV